MEIPSNLNNFNYKKDKSESDYVLLQKQDDFLKFILKKGVAYTGELVKEIQVNYEDTGRIINHYVKLGYIKRVYPDPNNMDALFRGRIQELWLMGIYGFETISRFTWWTTTEAGLYYCGLRFKGTNTQVKGSLFRYYDIDIPKGEEFV